MENNVHATNLPEAIKMLKGEKTKEPFVEPILQFFEYEEYVSGLQRVMKPFHEAAHYIHNELPKNPERTVALRKLLEAKDAAVRAALFK